MSETSTTAESLAADFLAVPSSVATDPKICAAVTALMMQQAMNDHVPVDVWAEKLARGMSHVTD